jgi:diguanylate cyclase (GGDEF)-like protein/PAS domain S-box-containing protein
MVGAMAVDTFRRAMTDSSPDLLRLVLARLQEGVMIVGPDARIRDANPAAAAICGLPQGSLEGALLAEVLHRVEDLEGREIPWEDWPAARAIRGEDVAERVLSFRRPDDRIVWLEIEAGPVTDPETGEPDGCVVTFNDVTHRLERERRFRHEADHDHLTGLANRRLLERTLDITIARAQHNGRGVAVLLVDLDGFKEINDRHGHPAGDVVLREVADRLRCNLRERDLVARYGGDEFVLVLADLQHPEEVAAAFAERIHDAMTTAIDIGGRELRVRVSVGTAVHPADGRHATALLAAADRAMYSEKPGR